MECEWTQDPLRSSSGNHEVLKKALCYSLGFLRGRPFLTVDYPKVLNSLRQSRVLVSGKRQEVTVRPSQPHDWVMIADRTPPKTEHLGQAPIVLRFTADDAERVAA
jgi:hypothetical protein